MPKTNTEQIASALRALLNRSNPDSFVVFEEHASGKFLQFVGSSEEPLLLDLPTVGLTPDERRRATALFRELSGGGQTFSEPDDADEFPGYQHESGRDADAAAELAMRVFREVYLLPEAFPMQVEEN